MIAQKLLVGGVVAGLAVAVAVGAIGGTTACNSGNGACPTTPIVPDDPCSDDDLQCAFDLSTPAAACDGTTTTIPTSCTCTKGHWECPAPFECDAGEPDEAGDDSGDASAGDEPTDDGGDASD